MNRIPIPKTDVRRSFAEPSPAWGRDTSGELFIRCGGCRRCMGMDLHTVADDGTVEPSLHHDDPACNWHVWGTLLEWQP